MNSYFKFKAYSIIFVLEFINNRKLIYVPVPRDEISILEPTDKDMFMREDKLALTISGMMDVISKEVTEVEMAEITSDVLVGVVTKGNDVVVMAGVDIISEVEL